MHVNYSLFHEGKGPRVGAWCHGATPKHMPAVQLCRLNEPPCAARRIFFQHIWKAGGSNLCRMAERNNEVFFHHNTNYVLNWDLHIRDHYTFIDHPGPMQTNFALLDPTWTFITMFRNPLTQPLSTFMNHWGKRSVYALDFIRWIETASWHSEPVAQSDIATSNRSVYGYGQHFIDNQHTRWICGTACNVPVLQRSHFLLAVENLFRFKHVMIMEEFDSVDRCRFQDIWPDLESRRGDGSPWAGTYNAKANAHIFNTFMDDPQLVRRLSEVQRWDLRLFKVAKRLAEAQRIAYVNQSCAISYNIDLHGGRMETKHNEL